MSGVLGAAATSAQIGAEITDWVATAILRGDVRWRPGALDLLQLAVASEMRTALVTMAYRAVAHAVASSTGLRVFDVIVAGDDVSHQKPHPEPYLLAIQGLKITPERAVVVEDTLTGAQSALAAGLSTVLVTDQHAVDSNQVLARSSLSGLSLGELCDFVQGCGARS